MEFIEDKVIIDPVILNLAVALGIGLLIGAERERRKGVGSSRSPAGIRTFAVTSLAGGVSFIVGGEVLVAIMTTGVVILTAAAYWRGNEVDPGLTTEIALILTALLGGLSERAAQAMSLLYPNQASELQFKNPVLAVFANAIWHCSSAAEVCTVLNEAASKLTLLCGLAASIRSERISCQ